MFPFNCFTATHGPLALCASLLFLLLCVTSSHHGHSRTACATDHDPGDPDQWTLLLLDHDASLPLITRTLARTFYF